MLIFAEFTIIFDLMSLEIPLLKLLAKRDKLGNTRKLGTFGNELIDFSSNDWGVGASAICKKKIWASQYGLVWDGITNYNGC